MTTVCSKIKNKYEVVGYNYRITNLQAAIGLAQINKIDTLLENRKEYAKLCSSSYLKNMLTLFQLMQ